MDGRKKLSGAAYKKLALAKKVKNAAIVKKCKNISEMFKKNVVDKSWFIFLFHTAIALIL